MKYKGNKLLSLIALISLLVFGGNEIMATEEPKYRVLEKDKDFELRLYEPQIVAETIVEGDFAEVGNIGFKRLFNYISGNNKKKQSIPMTAPVTQKTESYKIAMTAPVTQERAGDKWSIAFLIPSKYAIETVPEPSDSRIEIKQIPSQLMAALRYSGTWSKERYEENKAKLEMEIQKRAIKIVGEPIWSRYNPPFMPWFLRRNEVLIPVEKKE